MLPLVSESIEEIKANFPDVAVSAIDDGEGGACVILEDVALPPGYSHAVTWIGFRVNYLYPNADVYPHYVRPDLVRVDGRPMNMQPTTFENRQALQISRRSNKWDPKSDTAALKLHKILAWLADLR